MRYRSSPRALIDPASLILATMHANVGPPAMRRGLLAHPGGGCVDGERGDHVLLAPALTIRPDEIAELVDRLSLAIADLPFATLVSDRIPTPASCGSGRLLRPARVGS